MRKTIAAVAMSLSLIGAASAAEPAPATPSDKPPVHAEDKDSTKPADSKATPEKDANKKPADSKPLDAAKPDDKPATELKKVGEKGAEAKRPASEEPPRMTEPLKPTEGSQGPQPERSSSSPRLANGEQVDTAAKIKPIPEEMNQRTDTTSTKNDTEIRKDNPIR